MPARRTYSIDERRAIVAEVLRRYAAGEGSYRAIAEALGVRENEFQYWRRAYPPLPETPSTPAPSKIGPVAVEPSGKKAPPPPYPPAERERFVREVDRLRAAGKSQEVACKAAGISADSYRRWREELAPIPAMRPVEVAARPPEMMALVPAAPQALTLAPPRPAADGHLVPVRGLTLVAPGGYRVEGLAVETAAALLRALA